MKTITFMERETNKDNTTKYLASFYHCMERCQHTLWYILLEISRCEATWLPIPVRKTRVYFLINSLCRVLMFCTLFNSLCRLLMFILYVILFTSCWCLFSMWFFFCRVLIFILYLILFSGCNYWTYKRNWKVDGPNLIDYNFPGLPCNIDAALNLNDTVYFFQNNNSSGTYWTYKYFELSQGKSVLDWNIDPVICEN